MPYTIRVTPPELRKKADYIDSNAEIVKKEADAIAQIINRLRPTFLGETASAFFKEFDSAMMSADQWNDIVRSFATEIREAAKKLESADRSHE